MHWNQFKNGREARGFMLDVAKKIRENELDLGRKHYALTLSLGVLSAIFCDVGRIVAIEFGVGTGGGLLDLCKAAEFFRRETGMSIEVYGFDNATGLPDSSDYRDHQELWRKGNFRLPDSSALSAKLPDYAHLVIGDIADTLSIAEEKLGDDNKLGFVAVDVDYYSSALSCLKLLKGDVSLYMPVVPMYFDDFMKSNLTSNSWCGEALAISEFNRDNAMRKIEANSFFNNGAWLRPYNACHILDHPLRSGAQPCRPGFSLLDLMFV